MDDLIKKGDWCGYRKASVKPCKDAVSREWLLNELEEMNVANFYELNEHSNEMYGQMKRMIKAAPSVTVEPKQEWIPCEERLPVDGEWCLVSVNAIDDIPYEIVISDKVSYCYERGWATAWMLLPKPYMKGADDEF